MNAVVQNLPADKAAPTFGVALLQARVQTRRRIKTQQGPVFLTVVRLPSVDEFSSAAVCELRSVQDLGEPGTVVRVKVRIGGYPRTYDGKDDMGQTVKVTTATNSLEVIAVA